MDTAPKIACIIRTHRYDDLRRFEEALASALGQDDVDVTAFVLAQRPEPQALERLQQVCNWLSGIHARPCRIIPVHEGPADARTHMLNVALRHIKADGDFDAFGVLDSDDALLSGAYLTLYDAMRRDRARISFARVYAADVAPCDGYDRMFRLSSPWSGRSKSELMKGNFAPIHSYLVSLEGDTSHLSYNEDYLRLEDYEFLVRIASSERITFRSINTHVGLYKFYANEENSTPRTSDSPASLSEKKALWDEYREKVMDFRSTLKVQFWAGEF